VKPRAKNLAVSMKNASGAITKRATLIRGDGIGGHRRGLILNLNGVDVFFHICMAKGSPHVPGKHKQPSAAANDCLK
jgi:hypothetical protein